MLSFGEMTMAADRRIHSIHRTGSEEGLGAYVSAQSLLLIA